VVLYETFETDCFDANCVLFIPPFDFVAFTAGLAATFGTAFCVGADFDDDFDDDLKLLKLELLVPLLRKLELDREPFASTSGVYSTTGLNTIAVTANVAKNVPTVYDFIVFLSYL